MEAPRTDLVRALRSAPELRATDEGDSLGYLSGHVITWGDWYEINSVYEGRFMERIAPGATTKTIRENRAAIKVLFDHGHDPALGNKVLGELTELEEDDIGLRYGLGLFDTSYNRDLLPGLKAGVYGSSHRFRAIKDEWDDNPTRSEQNPEGIPTRTIRELSLHELGPVAFPASPHATAGVRSVSMTDEWRSRNGIVVPKETATPQEPAPTTTEADIDIASHLGGPTSRERRITALRLRGVIE